MSEGLYQLPEGWRWEKMGDIADVVGGGTPKTKEPKNYAGGKIPWLTPADLSGYEGKYIGHGGRMITERGLHSSSAKMMPAGTVLFTSRAPIGYVAIASNPISTNQGFKSFVLKDENLLPEYVYWWLKGNKPLAESLASGTTFLELSGRNAKQLPIPIAPPKDQKRIVAEIEKQFSRLDEAVASLKRVKANLKRYKDAVLKAAVEGKLTEDWRKQNPDVEPASKLLERILAERRAKWEEAELAKMKAKGKGPKNDKWKEKYKGPAASAGDELRKLPSTWAWFTWDQLLAFDEGAFRRGPFGGSLKKSIFVKEGYNVYEQYCPINDDPKFARYFITKEKYLEMEKFSVQAKDFLVSCAGTFGRITQVPDDFAPGIINQALLRVRVNNSVISDDCFLSLFRSPYFQQQLIENSQGAAMVNMKGVKHLKAIPVPVPPLEEQSELLRFVDACMSVYAALESNLEATIRRSARLRQSILATSFGGGLD